MRFWTVSSVAVGRCYWSSGRPTEALAEFSRALERLEAPPSYLRHWLDIPTQEPLVLASWIDLPTGDGGAGKAAAPKFFRRTFEPPTPARPPKQFDFDRLTDARARVKYPAAYQSLREDGLCPAELFAGGRRNPPRVPD